ncbi:hypothetical protein BKA70DRAFT_1221726 [Coprinopsis sp. MPI-PUGE-AT-0042]|nr:hypothetical protein BKA70DRAFT_1221726 [Coprinopsis sp. MPI-PUGE-AT-0042]
MDQLTQRSRAPFPVPQIAQRPQTLSTSAAGYGLPPSPPLSDTTSDPYAHGSPLPPHWNNKFPNVKSEWLRRLLESTFTVLCMVSFGHTTLDHKWKMTNSSEEAFVKDKELISQRITTVTVVASLLLTSAAALVTTDPPKGSIMNYTARGPYLCLWAAFGILIGGIIVASADVYVLATCYPKWVYEVLMATRGRIWCVLILLAYPFFAVGVGVIVCVMGLLVAAWISQDRIVQTGCVFLLLVPASLIFFFMVIVRGKVDQPIPLQYETSHGGM